VCEVKLTEAGVNENRGVLVRVQGAVETAVGM
jgi:hypothetical protein